MIEKLFLNNEDNLTKKTFFWTLLSGVTYSGSTYLMFLVCSQFLGAYWAGIFSISMSVGQQLVTIGYFNMRPFQVSDINGEYSFSDYFISKLITSSMMLIAFGIWAFVGEFSWDKLFASFLLLIFKIGETLADVCQGLYQQKGRYDVSGRCMFYETVLYLIAFFVLVFATKNLFAGLAGMAGAYIISVFAVEGRIVRCFQGIIAKPDFKKQRELFQACMPLFVNSFLLMYINNASKYAIDKYEAPEDLAKFNTIFMVAFVINLLAGVILKPMISVMAGYYSGSEHKKFRRIIFRQLAVIMAFTLICILGAYICGIPVLSFVSGLDLDGYRMILCLILLGGAFNAVYQLFQYTIIIMRKQKACFWGAVGVAAVTMLVIPVFVKKMAVSGAAVGYVISMLLLAVVYAVMTFYYLKRR